MLLRSSSTPVLNSWLPPNSRDSSPSAAVETETLHLPRTKSISLTTSTSFSDHDNPSKSLTHNTLSDPDLRDAPLPKRRATSQTHFPLPPVYGDADEQPTGEVNNCKTSSLQRLFSSSGLDEAVGVVGDDQGCGVDWSKRKEDGVLSTLVGGDGCGIDGGRICGGDGGGQGGTDAYYQKMIEANPGNALLLLNYARFLKEVRGDLEKAEYYCGRAILENQNDGNALSLYADIIWEARRDAGRAESYFDQAVKSSPGDCYVMASYARFLWETEEEEVGGENQFNDASPTTATTSAKLWEDAPLRSPLTAAS
ncbi:hypothetical protein Ancab_012039 [Ancistrocladus abbreviatus]